VRVVRFLVLGLAAAAALAVSAFLTWIDDRAAGDIPVETLWGDGGQTADFASSLAVVLLVLAGVALVATFVAGGWQLALDGVVALAVVIAWFVQEGSDGDVGAGVWVAAAGGVCAVLAFVLGRRRRVRAG
jgi:hypothetical protein